MKNQIKLLPALVMALGATLALAFNTPSGEAVQGRFGLHFNPVTQQNEWIDTQNPGVNYRCNTQPAEVCLYNSMDINDPSDASGEFELL